MDGTESPSFHNALASSRQLQLMVDLIRYFLAGKSFIIIMHRDPLAQGLMYLLIQDVVQIWLTHQYQAEAV